MSQIPNEINANFDQRVIVHAATLDWIPSPMKGVDRRPLDRVGAETARATSIVRYAPGSHFSPHVHTGGEEFIVLEGVFQDEHGDFPVGSYIRNPPQSRHTPGSEAGCVIFVKLWQFEPEDRTHVRLQIDKMAGVSLDGIKGIQKTPLFKDSQEEVSLYSLQADASLALNVTDGAEFLVLSGTIEEAGDTLETESWLRLPENYGETQLKAGIEGAKIWVKQGNLCARAVQKQISRLTKAR